MTVSIPDLFASFAVLAILSFISVISLLCSCVVRNQLNPVLSFPVVAALSLMHPNIFFPEYWLFEVVSVAVGAVEVGAVCVGLVCCVGTGAADGFVGTGDADCCVDTGAADSFVGTGAAD